MKLNLFKVRVLIPQSSSQLFPITVLIGHKDLLGFGNIGKLPGVTSGFSPVQHVDRFTRRLAVKDVIEFSGLMNFAVVDVDGRKEELRIISTVEGKCHRVILSTPTLQFKHSKPEVLILRKPL